MVQAVVASDEFLHEGIVRRCAKGDQIAWKQLYEEHYGTARRFLLSMGVPQRTVDDTCQDVFLQAFRYLPSFRGECSFKTWLYRICTTEARRARHRTRVGQLLQAQLWVHDTEEGTHGDVPETQAAHLVNSALAKLAEAERLVFVLYEFEGLSGSEIALISACPEATVYRRLHYARKAFRASILERGAVS